MTGRDWDDYNREVGTLLRLVAQAHLVGQLQLADEARAVREQVQEWCSTVDALLYPLTEEEAHDALPL